MECSFCHRNKTEVVNIFLGPITTICNECLIAGKLNNKVKNIQVLKDKSQKNNDIPDVPA